MTDLPLVSIVTPSFNQGQFLEETILSVLRQDYPNIEYIIIDGGSTDGSQDIIRKYEHRLAYWVSEKDRGQTHAIIKGFRKAKGEYLSWLCSDDILEPSMVSISLYFMRKDPNIGLTFGDRIRIDGKGNIYSFSRYSKFRNWYLKWGLTLPQETVLMRRNIYEVSGGLDESLHMAMDFDLWCKIIKIAIIFHIPAYLGRFRAHVNNKSSIFTSQISNSNFQEGFPLEFSEVYQRHFSRKPSLYLAKIGGLFRSIHAFLQRRTKQYRVNFKEVKNLQLK